MDPVLVVEQCEPMDSGLGSDMGDEVLGGGSVVDEYSPRRE